jgi:inner membrane protein
MEKKEVIKNSLSLKMFIIGFLVAILMIPTGMIAVLVNERENTQEAAIAEVSEKWGREQTITGPVLTIPYKKISESNVNGQKKINEVIQYAHFLPDSLSVDGQINPETRQRGIYEVVVYNSALNVKGEFTAPDFSKWEIAPETIMYDKAFVSLGIPDMRGVKEEIILNWNGGKQSFRPGLETNDVLQSGVTSMVKIDKEDKGKKYKYDFKLVLNGSGNLNFSPIGKITEVKLTSSWQDPSFQGAFLPNSYEINDQGFVADWKVLELNRNFPQSFLGSMPIDQSVQPNIDEFNKYQTTTQIGNMQSSNFGVRLLITADEYQKTVRALKYAIMILGLTFLTLFFFEAMRKKQVHPLQYILIGLALSLFYVLLLSISEYLGFNQAYWISAAATVALITLYSKSVFGAWKPALIESLLLLFIYSFIFVILQLKDYSLLVGSLGLFVILAVVMFVSRKIDWYNVGSEK